MILEHAIASGSDVFPVVREGRVIVCLLDSCTQRYIRQDLRALEYLSIVPETIYQL